MKRMLKGFFSLALLTSAAVSFGAEGNPYLSIRSQSVNAAREIAGWETHINLFDRDCFYGSFSITPEYTRTFRAGRIAEFLFGDDLQTVDNSGSLVISGSRSTAPRNAKDWLADNFGLPTDFKSTVNFKPRISNFLVDFNLYLGLDEWVTGMYFRIHAPVVHTRWELNASETVTTPGVNNYVNGYMNLAGPLATTIGVANSALRKSFLSAVDGTYTFGDMTNALKYGKIAGSSTTTNSSTTSRSRLTKTRLSDVEAALGWNFWQCEDYHFGLQVRGSAPTGNRPEAEFLFEPIVGNGHHWTLGGGVSSHAVLWRGCDEDRFFAVYMDANITHLLRTRQTRSFDFVNKPNSRYMLLEEMKSDITGGLRTVGTTGAVPNAQYAGKLLPAINVTTLDVDTSIAVQGDMVLKFAYVSGCFEADLGYNLWGRSGEKFKAKQDPIITEKKYAIKGDASIYAFTTATGGAGVALSATQSTADIHAGKGDANSALGSSTNAGIDNSVAAFDATANLVNGIGNAINTSNPAVLVKSEDINITAKTPSALSHKVFGHISYNWNDCEDWIPFIGVGGEVEFGNGRSNDSHAAVSQWGVWLKGGLSFN